jgi:hypothetical protein
MAKIRVNNLPEGFEIKNGKIVKKMAYGGHTTGDQSEYGLVTVPSSRYDTFFNEENVPDVRYSLSSVPRDVANVEAEGGETVLADLNNDGNFGLYDIKGPRHSKGGVPLYMPPQSFFYSDTPAMKLKRDELAELGIKSKKGMTPAQVSKMPGFQINEYYGALKDEFVDPIKRNSAELMIKKNKMNLSKLAFTQEAKKKFEDGVPTASYPFLVSQGQDPIEFTQRVEDITRQEAEMKAMASLPPEQLQQMMMLRDFLAQAQAEQEAMAPVNMAQNGPMAVPAAQYGMEMDVHDDLVAQDEMMLGNENLGAMQEGGQEEGYEEGYDEMSDEEMSEKSGQGEQVVIGDYQTQNFDLCPRASELYEELAEEGDDMELVQQSAALHDDLFGIERNAIAQDYATKEDVAMAKELAANIFEIAKDMGLLKAHGYIKDHIKKIEELSKNVEQKRYGGQKDLPKFQAGEEWNWETDASGSPVTTVYDQSGQPVTTEVVGFANPPGTATVVTGDAAVGVDNSKSDESYDGTPAMRDYGNLERLLKSNDPKWERTLNRAYEAFKAAAKSYNISIPTKEEMLDRFLRFQKNNYSIKGMATPEERQLSGWSENLGTGFGDYDDAKRGKNYNTQEFFNALAKRNKAYPGYKIDDTETKQNQTFFQALFLADKDNAEPYLDVIYEGPDQDVNWIQNKKISKVEGFYGNNTLNQFVKVREPRKPKKPVEPKDGCPCISPEGKYTGTYSKECCPVPGEFKSNYRPPQYQFWAQDVLKANAIAQRDRRMFMPWQPAVGTPQVDYVLEDPTREIAANMEAFNIGAQAIGTFGGPQALAARTAQAMGNAFKANADTLANVNSRNVSTVNAGKALNAQFQERGMREQRDRQVKEYDDTQKVLQEFLNERNYDREKYADAYANMLTNAAYTYDLNTLNPYYNIMPATGGIIQMTNTKGRPNPSKQSATTPMYEQLEKKAIELTNKGIPEKTVNMILKSMSGEALTTDEDDAVMEAMRKSLNFPFTPNKAKRGKEMKKYAVPFYSGKMGY